MEHIKTGMIFPEKNEYNILQALTITVSASFFAFFQKHLTLYTLPHVISGKINFLRKAPSKSPLKLAISEEIFRLRIKNLQKGVGKYHFQRFIGRGIIIFQNFPKSCPILSLPIQSI